MGGASCCTLVIFAGSEYEVALTVHIPQQVVRAPEGVFYGRQAIEKRYGDIVFQQWHCNNHVQQIGQVIAVGNEAVWVGEWSRSCGGNQVHGYISNVAVREGECFVAGESAAALTRLTMYNATGSITCFYPSLFVIVSFRGAYDNVELPGTKK